MTLETTMLNIIKHKSYWYELRCAMVALNPAKLTFLFFSLKSKLDVDSRNQGSVKMNHQAAKASKQALTPTKKTRNPEVIASC